MDASQHPARPSKGGADQLISICLYLSKTVTYVCQRGFSNNLNTVKENGASMYKQDTCMRFYHTN